MVRLGEVVPSGRRSRLETRTAACEERFARPRRLTGRSEVAMPDHKVLVRDGMRWFRDNHFDKALTCFQCALAIEPSSNQTLQFLGIIEEQSEHCLKSPRWLLRAIHCEPSNAAIIGNLGVSLLNRKALGEAITQFEKAIVLSITAAEHYVHLGNGLFECDYLERAICVYRRFFYLNGYRADVLNRNGLINELLGLHDEAFAGYARAAVLKPEDGAVRFNIALAQLLSGRYREGFRNMESRYSTKWRSTLTHELPSFLQLRKEDLSARDVVLLQAEQGFGDTIQFCRYGALVSGLGGKVVMLVPEPLVRLMSCQPWVSEAVKLGDAVPAYDVHCPMMSLPLAFGTTLETIPFGREAYLRALPEEVERWRERLGVRSRPRVGLVWNGGFRADQPELWAVNERRNVPLELFAQALDIEGIDFVSLQKGDPAESEIRGREGEYWKRGRLYNYTSELSDFADTAGLIANLDLVISVDTSTAHLSAAMGKPTWILNRYDTCWRWLLDREDSPWYPAVRLYRQSAYKDWATVLDRVNNDLRQWAQA